MARLLPCVAQQQVEQIWTGIVAETTNSGAEKQVYVMIREICRRLDGADQVEMVLRQRESRLMETFHPRKETSVPGFAALFRSRQ